MSAERIVVLPRAPEMPLDDERFQVRSKLEIVGILRTLVDKKELTTIYFGGRDFVVSMALAVDPDAGLLVLDMGADAGANDRLLRASRLIVVSQVAHVKVQFATGAAEEVRFNGMPAFQVTLPQTLLRLQRRDWFRLRLPPEQALRCELTAEWSDARGPTRRAARVVDISCGGLGLTELPLAVIWEPGAVHAACRLPLPQIGTVIVDLEVVRFVHRAPGAGVIGRHVGAHFLGLPESARASIQRFINAVQRAQIARER